MKTYKIERRMFKVKTGWFKSEMKPMWCLVECGVHTIYTNGGSQVYADEMNYETVILKSEDKSYIEQELVNYEWCNQ